MADTAFKNEEEKKEYFDTPEDLEKKVQLLSEWVKESNSFCIFTGAGISTSSGIPDYRSGADTVMPTGAGCWENMANIEKAKKQGKLNYAPAIKSQFNLKISQAMPNMTHMSFVALQDAGILKGVVSQNIDGLHRKSGILAENIAELHGNTNLEMCKDCGKEYMRDFKVRTNLGIHDHETGRYCDNPKCKGELYDSIINFGEGLNQGILQKGSEMGMTADLMMCMGTSMKVEPACSIPLATKLIGGRMVMCNLQKTVKDEMADLIIHAKCDDVMALLMSKLNIAIPPYKVRRWLEVDIEELKDGSDKVNVQGIDMQGGPYDLFNSMKLNGQAKSTLQLEQKSGDTFTVKLAFQGHYNENDLEISLSRKYIKQMGNSLRFEMIGDPYHEVPNGRATFWEHVQPFKKLIKLNDKIAYKQSAPGPKAKIPIAVPPKKKPTPKPEQWKSISNSIADAMCSGQDTSISTAHSTMDEYKKKNDEDAMPPSLDYSKMGQPSPSQNFMDPSAPNFFGCDEQIKSKGMEKSEIQPPTCSSYSALNLNEPEKVDEAKLKDLNEKIAKIEDPDLMASIEEMMGGIKL